VLALVVVLLVVTVLLVVVVTGLLRSHADIIRALHTLGVGVGDPAGPPSMARDVPVHLSAGPPLPGERSSSSSHDIEGVAPGGDSVVVAMDTAAQTLLAFLSSGCVSCGAFWSALGQADQIALLPAGIRVVIVTKGPEWESPSAIAAKAPRGVPVVMSTDAWGDYEVPGSPYFALVDGASGVRVGEGVANQWSQIADLVNRARNDVRPAPATLSRAASLGLNGAERESANDAELMAAGIFPGDPSLYPDSLDDVFASTSHLASPGPATRPVASRLPAARLPASRPLVSPHQAVEKPAAPAPDNRDPAGRD
jgi:hypothetical protein